MANSWITLQCRGRCGIKPRHAPGLESCVTECSHRRGLQMNNVSASCLGSLPRSPLPDVRCHNLQPFEVTAVRLAINWNKPIPLLKDTRNGLTYDVNFDKIKPSPGIYMFARKWGSSYEALYVGKSENLRSRIKTHLNNHRLVKHIEGASSGKRVVIIGYPCTRSGQQMARVLKTLERVLIRHFLAEAHDLVNIHGIRIERHEIESDGGIPKAFIPSKMFLERSNGD